MKIEDLLNSPFSFNQRKTFTPCETRPLWKCALVVLIVGMTGQEKRRCSLKKIHTSNWLTKSSEHVAELNDWSESNMLFSPNIRLDPFIDRAIELLAASGYIWRTEGKIELTPKGEEFFKKIEQKEDLMVQEKSTLKAAKKQLSEAAIERIFKAN
jgi:hypothetical protein